MTPLQFVVEQFDGVTETARVCGLRHHSPVIRWLKPRKDGGKDGLIPSEYHSKILREAKKRGLPITADNLIYGDKIPKPIPKPQPDGQRG